MVETKKWEQLGIEDDFIFKKLMMNKELCKKILSEILGREVVDVTYPEYEKTINITRDSKAVRLDVYLKDEDSVYNVEMQNSMDYNLPKRSRYYQGVIDMDKLEKGCHYSELNKSYVIFICTFDYFKCDYYKYTFTNKCTEIEGMEMNDETTKIFLNSKGHLGDVSDDLKKFLDCVNGVYKSDEFSATIKKEVERIKSSEEWRAEYMNLHLHDMDIKYYSRQEGLEEGIQKGRREGLQEGRQEGLEEGKREGQLMLQQINKLNKILIAQKRLDDLEKSANDPEYQKQLLKEFGIE